VSLVGRLRLGGDVGRGRERLVVDRGDGHGRQNQRK
jgi:hypothetical protein